MLSLCGDTHALFKEQITLMLKSQRNDFHKFFDKYNIGIVFVSERIYTHNKLRQKCELYAYERKINNWFVVIIGDNFIDFEQFHYANDPNDLLEKKIEELRAYRIQQALKVEKKIGRNELCPCGSGKKYKKCCLNK